MVQTYQQAVPQKITQKLLINVTGLFQCNEISEQTKNDLATAAKEAIKTHDYTKFLTLLDRYTKFCSYPELVENCKEIIANA